jgi:hypothetical protein
MTLQTLSIKVEETIRVGQCLSIIRLLLELLALQLDLLLANCLN